MARRAGGAGRVYRVCAYRVDCVVAWGVRCVKTPYEMAAVLITLWHYRQRTLKIPIASIAWPALTVVTDHGTFHLRIR